jgi:transposase InsO family protein
VQSVAEALPSLWVGRTAARQFDFASSDRGVERGKELAAEGARRRRRFRRTTDSNHPHPIAPNVLARSFHVELPNSAWVTDVTYVWTHEGWLYLAAILDLFSRRVVGWAASANNDRALAISALDRAVVTRAPAPGMIHHSDRGSVYASASYGDALTKIGAVKSMSRKGDCWDNAVAESFFATIKGEMIDHADYLTRATAIASIADYIDGFYNPCRRHSAVQARALIEGWLGTLDIDEQRRVAPRDEARRARA